MKNILVILFLIHSSLSIGQNSTVEEDKLFELLRNNRDSLGTKKNEIIDFISKNPLSNFRIVALEELASIEYQSGNIEESISLFGQVLKVKVVDSIGNTYKNSASKTLSKIYFDRKEFKTALKYLNYQKKYRYNSFCGNAQELEDLNVAMLFANCYLALGNENKAIDVLSPHMFDDIIIPNTEIVNLLFSIYQNIYTKEQIRTEFQNAHKSLSVKKENYGKLKYYEYSVKLFGRQTFVKGFLIDKNSDLKSKQIDFKKKAIEEILKSQFYAMTTRA
jgi:tetratricopeptide (TPR) repeat protein